MAFATFFRCISKSQNFNSTFLCKKVRDFSSFPSPPHCLKPFLNPCQVRPISTPAETVDGFGEMISGTERKYYMLGGKGGVGKTSCAAFLAVKFANHGHPTIVVSADPAHSLSASFDQDLRGGILVPVQGMPSPLFAIEINPERTKEDFRSAIQKDGGAGVKSFTDSMGLGMFSQQCMHGVALVPLEGAQSCLFPLEINSEKMKENFQSAIQRNYDSDVKDFMDGMDLELLSQQLDELELGELLVTPPLGLDRATVISKACYTTPMSSIDAVHQPIKIQRSSSKIIQCGPKKIKFAKQRRGRMKGIAHRGNHICFGRYALQALEPGWITSKQLESGRRALARNLGRGVKIWVCVFPDKPVTARPAETRMGRGKGNVQFWVAVVQPGRILYEMGGISESIARKAISVAASKLPIRTRFIALE